MSTVILEVAEEQEQHLFKVLETMPGVRVMNRPTDAQEDLQRYPWLTLRGKHKGSRVSSERLAATNEENKRLEA